MINAAVVRATDPPGLKPLSLWTQHVIASNAGHRVMVGGSDAVFDAGDIGGQEAGCIAVEISTVVVLRPTIRPMTAVQPAKNQVRGAHMVSSGYISAWADEKNVIAVLDMEKGIGYHKSYKKATVVNYVYEPALLSYDLEGEYARIESAGIHVVRKMRKGLGLTVGERTRLVEFLEMHRYRGRYSDRAEVRVPAVAVMANGAAKDVELRLGDMMLLTRDQEPGPKLTELGLEQWKWTVWEVDDIPTGDGAVMLWGSSSETRADGVSVVTFPLSPTQLLLIGDELPNGVPFSMRLAMNCRRWIVGKKGSLNLKQAAVIANKRATERAESPV